MSILILSLLLGMPWSNLSVHLAWKGTRMFYNTFFDQKSTSLCIMIMKDRNRIHILDWTSQFNSLKFYAFDVTKKDWMLYDSNVKCTITNNSYHIDNHLRTLSIRVQSNTHCIQFLFDTKRNRDKELSKCKRMVVEERETERMN